MPFDNGTPPVPTQPKEAPLKSNPEKPAQPKGNNSKTATQNNFYVPKEYFLLAQRMFPEVPAVNFQMYLPEVLKALVAYNLSDPTMVLMALATIRVETGKFAPISEYLSKYNTSPNGHPYDLYDFRTDIGNNAIGDGARYCGRGFIQLTGKANYQQYSKALGLGNLLIQDPEQANNPVIASLLLASFLKNHERVIRNALAQQDYATARKAVNGGSHGLEQFIASYETGANHIGLA